MSKNHLRQDPRSVAASVPIHFEVQSYKGGELDVRYQIFAHCQLPPVRAIGIEVRYVVFHRITAEARDFINGQPNLKSEGIIALACSLGDRYKSPLPHIIRYLVMNDNFGLSDRGC